MRYFSGYLIIVFCALSYGRPAGASAQQVFTTIYEQNSWGSQESVSGSGSTIEQTQEVRQQLPRILATYNIRSLLDAPCGDFNWMQHVSMPHCYYYGVDIIAPIIEQNKKLFAHNQRVFMVLDVIKDALPGADLIMCRDCLVHFPIATIYATLLNFKKSNAKYLLVTTFTNSSRVNYDIPLGSWRPLNLQNPPFNFPAPLAIINERCTEFEGQFSDKCLALWRLDDIVLP